MRKLTWGNAMSIGALMDSLEPGDDDLVLRVPVEIDMNRVDNLPPDERAFWLWFFEAYTNKG